VPTVLRAESEARTVARGWEWCGGAKGRHVRNNVLRNLLKEAEEELLQISRGISFHIEGAALLILNDSGYV